MNKSIKAILFLLRVGLGWLFLYAGLSKIANHGWSAAGYLNTAKTFPALYHWFASPANIGWVNLVNEWGLTLLGIFLILGFLVRWICWGGVLLMVLYYLPALQFPYAGTTGFLVDEHVIFALVLLLFYFSQAGQFWGLDALRKK